MTFCLSFLKNTIFDIWGCVDWRRFHHDFPGLQCGSIGELTEIPSRCSKIFNSKLPDESKIYFETNQMFLIQKSFNVSLLVGFQVIWCQERHIAELEFREQHEVFWHIHGAKAGYIFCVATGGVTMYDVSLKTRPKTC